MGTVCQKPRLESTVGGSRRALWNLGSDGHPQCHQTKRLLRLRHADAGAARRAAASWHRGSRRRDGDRRQQRAAARRRPTDARGRGRAPRRPHSCGARHERRGGCRGGNGGGDTPHAAAGGGRDRDVPPQNRRHRGGAGVSHAIGTGGRDLSQAVGGLTALAGISALASDPGTEVIVLISKPPSPEVAARLLGAVRLARKPVVINFVGASVAGEGSLHGAQTLEEAAHTAVTLVTGQPPRWHRWEALPAQEAGRLAPTQKYVRGLYSGGTLCYEALVLLHRYVGPVYSNTPLDPGYALESATRSHAHTVIDMGSDEFTVGRLHPMLDPTLRHQRLLREADDPEVAVILLDVVLGHGAHPDPARDLAPVIRQARERARTAGRWLPVVLSVCGTEEDPQGYETQVAALIDAGATVQATNARAVRLAGLIAEAAGSTGSPRQAVEIPAPAPSQPLPDASRILSLLHGPPRVVNVGLDLFAESLAAQRAETVAVDWHPPAGGKQKFIDLLDKLNA